MTFHLIDLISQVYTVENFLVNKSDVDTLQWLRTKGELTKLKYQYSGFSTVYEFCSYFELNSNIDFGCAFFLKNRQFIFVGDHTTFLKKVLSDNH